MPSKLSSIEWISELIPEIETKKNQFRGCADEIDDELIELFIAEMRRLTDELKKGLTQNNAEDIRSAAHSIKGMGGTIGLPEISVLALEIENSAKETRIKDALPMINALSEWVETLS
ncbi:MAG TPA: Hpt domain-containing protein [Pontiella sp.]